MAIQAAQRLYRVRQQAVSVRYEFPELYCYLQEREQALQRAARRVPCPADIELWAAPRRHLLVHDVVERLGPGLDELARGT